MSLDEVVAVTGETGFFRETVDDVIEGGQFIVMGGLMTGFDADALLYVETVPIEPAG